MRTYRTFRTAALIATIAVTTAGAGSIDGGGGPGQAVDLIATPPTFGNCEPPVATMIGMQTGFPTTTLTVRNRTRSTESQDALVLRVVDEGKVRMFWAPISLRPGSSASVNVNFSKHLDSREIILCGDHPVGDVDDPNPVATLTIDFPADI